MDRKESLIEKLTIETQKNKEKLDQYLDSLVLKRNRTSLMMNSFMHNIVDIENSVETTRLFLK